MLPNPASDQTVNTAKAPRSTLVSRNVTISGHRTSIRLEPEMWSGLSEVCRREGCTLHEVCTAVALRKGENTSLTAAIRVFVMAYYRAAATEEGHTKVGHGYGIATLASGMANGGRPQPSPAPLQTGLSAPGAPSFYANRMMLNGGNRGGMR